MFTIAHRARARRLLAMPLLAAALTGCAINPLVTWERPALGARPATLVEAQAFADAARMGYQRKRQAFVEGTTGLNAGLLGLGVLGVGLALASAHRDALVGTALVGGSAYAFGQQNLNRQHLLVYEAGIDAIGCAKEAVLPLTMASADAAALEGAMREVETALGETARRRADAQVALLAWKAADPQDGRVAVAAQSAITAAGSAIDAGRANVTQGRQLVLRAGLAGEHLVQAVERIDAAVNKAVTAQLPDPASVFKVIAGLPGFAGGIVPGADAALGDVVAKAGAALKPAVVTQSGNLNQSFRSIDAQAAVLDRALAALAAATDQLLTALAKVNGRLPTESALAGVAALKACGIAEGLGALKVAPAALTVPAGAERKTSFMVSGGTPPYVARLQVTPVEGVVVQSPAPFDSVVSVEITAKAQAQTVPIVVMDSAKPSGTVTVALEIQPAGAGGATESQSARLDGVAPAALADPAEVARAINRQKSFALPDTDLVVATSAAVQAGSSAITVVLRCKTPPKACYTANAAARLLATTVRATPSVAALIQPRGTSNACICAG